MLLEIARHQDIQVGFILHGGADGAPGVRVAQQDAHAARVGPVFRVQLVGLEGDLHAAVGEGRGDVLAGFGDVAGEWAGGAELDAGAAALGAGAGGVEVDGVEG